MGSGASVLNGSHVGVEINGGLFGYVATYYPHPPSVESSDSEMVDETTWDAFEGLW